MKSENKRQKLFNVKVEHTNFKFTRMTIWENLKKKFLAAAVRLRPITLR